MKIKKDGNNNYQNIDFVDNPAYDAGIVCTKQVDITKGLILKNESC